MATTTGAGSPCGACKFLRRRCVPDCVFAPYFSSDQGAARFAAIHKVFGASNVSKLLMHLPLADRCEAVVTITYEAQARIRDPVYGCVAQIFALQQQVAILQAQLMQTKAQLACGLLTSSHSPESHHQWQESSISPLLRPDVSCNPKRPLDCANYCTDGALLPDMGGFRDEVSMQHCTRRMAAAHTDVGELQYLAQTMMRSSHS